MFLWSSADIFQNDFFLGGGGGGNSFMNTMIGSNSLDPNQDRHSVGHDLGPNCFRRISADDKSGH